MILAGPTGTEITAYGLTLEYATEKAMRAWEAATVRAAL
jgi:hypothetical protein